jgi:hypothetical protein
MFKTDHTVRTLKTIAMVAGLAITLWSLGLPYTQFAGAANLTDVSDTLSDSAPSAASDHTIEFISTSGIAAGETITVTFPPEFATGTVDYTDIDFLIDSADTTLDSTPSGATWGAAITGSSLVLTSGTGVIDPGDPVEIRIGQFGSTTLSQLTNPATPDPYQIQIVTGAGPTEDVGTAIVVILAPVLVEASVDTRFTFQVDGVNAGVTVNGDATDATSTPTNIPFGTLEPSITTMLAHELTINTNASNGYVVTVQIDGPLESSGGDIIQPFFEGSDTDTPAGWNLTTPDINSSSTWSHWGVTTSDTDTVRSTEFTSDQYIAASTTPRVVASHNGPSDGAEPGEGNTFIGFKAVVSDFQPAGSDYNTNLTYIATPTF